MDKRAKWGASQPKEKIFRIDDKSGPPSLARIDRAVYEARFLARPRYERSHVVVAADDAVERDDVRGRNAVRNIDEISLNELNARRMASPFSFLPRGAQIGRRRIDVYRAIHSTIQQRVVNGADACPDIEEQAGRFAVAALRYCGLHILDEHPSCPVRAFAPEFLELATCALRVE